MRKHRNPSFVFILTSLALLITLVGGSWSTAYGAGLAQGGFGQAGFVTPTLQITAVQPDQSVTLRTANFPANDTFNVLMNTFGTRGVGGVRVDTINSGSGGALTLTFNIPASLQGQRLIAIRLESPTSGYFSYNWFYNTSTTTPPGGGIPPTGGLPSGTIPTIAITSVVPDNTVTIATSNYPANDNFRVLMNRVGTRGVGGYQVATFSSGSGGSFSQTFNIPNELKGLRQIAIRVESPTSGYFSYNWFYNTTGGTAPGGGIPPTGGPGTLPPGVIPTITITAVSKDNTVTVQTSNYPTNNNFTVTMGAFGTKGVGGANAGTWNSGTGGTQTATFNIPASMKGVDRIAIRLESAQTGYFSFNWFANQNYP